MSDVEHKYWAVMYNKDGHISMTPSDGKPTPEGTTVRRPYMLLLPRTHSHTRLCSRSDDNDTVEITPLRLD